MAAWNIQGRDAFSATSGTGAIDFAPINIGTAAGAGASSGGGSTSTLLLVGLVIVAAVLLFKKGRVRL